MDNRYILEELLRVTKIIGDTVCTLQEVPPEYKEEIQAALSTVQYYLEL